jgi:UPF0271 protein
MFIALAFKFKPSFMLMPGSRFGVVVRVVTFRSIIKEGFADRRHRSDGSLVPRGEPGAVLEDPEEIRRQILEIAPKVDSICIHGDTPNCLEFAELVNKTLVDAKYEVGY